MELRIVFWNDIFGRLGELKKSKSHFLKKSHLYLPFVTVLLRHMTPCGLPTDPCPPLVHIVIECPHKTLAYNILHNLNNGLHNKLVLRGHKQKMKKETKNINNKFVVITYQ